jgi:hypothetical protein
LNEVFVGEGLRPSPTTGNELRNFYELKLVATTLESPLLFPPFLLEVESKEAVR